MLFVEIAYYAGLIIGLTLWMFYEYWRKMQSVPGLPFDKKYLVPWVISVIIAILELVSKLLGNPPLIPYNDPWQAFLAGVAVYFTIQEVLKGILKNPKIDFFGETKEKHYTEPKP